MIVNSLNLWTICCFFLNIWILDLLLFLDRKKSSKQNCFMLSSWLLPCHLTEKNIKSSKPDLGQHFLLWLFHHKSFPKGLKSRFQIKWRPKEYRCRAIGVLWPARAVAAAIVGTANSRIQPENSSNNTVKFGRLDVTLKLFLVRTHITHFLFTYLLTNIVKIWPKIHNFSHFFFSITRLRRHHYWRTW